MVESQPLAVGVIGLGAMGRPIARRIAEAGYALSIHSRSRTHAAEFLALGATWCESPAVLASRSEVILVAVATEDDLAVVLGGPNGVLGSVRAGAVVCDLGTHSPRAMVRHAAAFRAAGADFLDAPVSGGDIGARDGTLVAMAGGDAASLALVRPVLATFAASIVHIGAVGSGAVAKACNQLVVGSTIEAVAEALALAIACGVDPARVREAMLGGFAASRVLDLHGQRMLTGDFEPGARADLHAKDAHIVLDEARLRGLDLPGFVPAAAAFDRLVADGQGGLDHSAVFTLLRRD